MVNHPGFQFERVIVVVYNNGSPVSVFVVVPDNNGVVFF
jgi:hypothetical protein